MEEQIEAYVICEACLIGGYDFCPKCLGGGGYSTKISKSDTLIQEPVSQNRQSIIERKLNLIIEKAKWNEIIEAKLIEYYQELIEKQPTPEVLNLLRRIISIRRNNYGRILYQKYSSIVKDSINSRFVFKNEYFTIESNNNFYKKSFNDSVIFKLNQNQSVSFPPKLLIGFIKNLHLNADVSYSNSHSDFFLNYTNKDIEVLRNNDQMFIFLLADYEVLNFTIKIPKIKRVCIEYINMLQSINEMGWYYI